MNQQVLSPGDKVLVITRRLYAEDIRRHFVGRVTAVSDGMFRIEGHVWVANSVGRFERRPEARTRVFSAISGSEIVMMIPSDVDLAKVEFKTTPLAGLTLTDGADFALNLSEFAIGF